MSPFNQSFAAGLFLRRYMMSDASDCQKDSSDASRSSSEEQQSKHAEANLDVKNGPESPDTDQALRNVSQERESHVYTATSIILPSRQKTTRNHPLVILHSYNESVIRLGLSHLIVPMMSGFANSNSQLFIII